MHHLVSEGQWAGRLIHSLILCDFSDPVSPCESSYTKSCCGFTALETVGLINKAHSWLSWPSASRVDFADPPERWTNAEDSFHMHEIVSIKINHFNNLGLNWLFIV